MLPSAVHDSLMQHVRGVKAQHDEDLKHGLGRVSFASSFFRDSFAGEWLQYQNGSRVVAAQ
jgi:hypothetical protein